MSCSSPESTPAPIGARPEDTIVALSTPPGEGALAVVRLSGPDAIAIGDRIFRGRCRLAEFSPGHARLGVVLGGDGSPVDQAVATVLKAPRSYTGEDVVEFSGHGGLLVSRLVIEAAMDAGARPAQPGEFTRRAFLNGRMDLSQAEAVVDLIRARGEKALKNALAQLNGGLSSRLGRVRGRILDLLVPIDAFIDFGDDVPEPPGLAELRPNLDAARQEIEGLLAGSHRGRLISEGASVVLVGKPNVGKSSLLNAIAGRDRAIVHPVPGTTRDTIDVTLVLKGIPITLTDTAGLRTTPDPVEEVGVDRARRALESAHLVLLVVDASAPPDLEDRDVGALAAGRESVVLRNKSDLGDDPEGGAWCRGLGAPVRLVSAAEGTGIAELIDEIGSRMESQAGSDEGVAMTRARQVDALRRGAAALARSIEAADRGAYADMIAAELRDALGCIGEITGESAGPEILDRIFSTFCIGK